LSNLTTVLHVLDVMSNKVLTVRNDELVYKVAATLVKNDVGSIVVVDKKGSLSGIITKGDILREVLLKGLDPKKTLAKQVMSQKVIAIGPAETVEEASKRMIEKRVSKLPVVNDEGKLVGIITSTDIIRTEPGEINYLQELIRARFVPHELR
jgi:CBS domain-containing protein